MASLQPYGAFVALGENMNGLLHISQISHDRISSVEQVLQPGMKLKARALHHPALLMLSCLQTSESQCSCRLTSPSLGRDPRNGGQNIALDVGFFSPLRVNKCDAFR